MREDRFRVFSRKVLGLCKTLEKLELTDKDDMEIIRASSPRDLFSRFFMVRVERVKKNAETAERYRRKCSMQADSGVQEAGYDE